MVEEGRGATPFPSLPPSPLGTLAQQTLSTPGPYSRPPLAVPLLTGQPCTLTTTILCFPPFSGVQPPASTLGIHGPWPPGAASPSPCFSLGSPLQPLWLPPSHPAPSVRSLLPRLVGRERGARGIKSRSQACLPRPGLAMGWPRSGYPCHPSGRSTGLKFGGQLERMGGGGGSRCGESGCGVGWGGQPRPLCPSEFPALEVLGFPQRVPTLGQATVHLDRPWPSGFPAGSAWAMPAPLRA